MSGETAEEIASHYSAALDSVTLINGLISADVLDAGTIELAQKNVDHLDIMVAKDYWTSEDMSLLNNAVTAGNTFLSK